MRAVLRDPCQCLRLADLALESVWFVPFRPEAGVCGGLEHAGNFGVLSVEKEGDIIGRVVAAKFDGDKGRYFRVARLLNPSGAVEHRHLDRPCVVVTGSRYAREMPFVASLGRSCSVHTKSVGVTQRLAGGKA